MITQPPSTPMSSAALKDLQRIPGVGPSIARDLLALGLTRVSELRGRDPERLYARSNQLRGQTQDRCLLYVFRCAVYFAEEKKPDPERLKWWNWSDAKLRTTGTASRKRTRVSVGR